MTKYDSYFGTYNWREQVAQSLDQEWLAIPQMGLLFIDSSFGQKTWCNFGFDMQPTCIRNASLGLTCDPPASE